MLDDRSYMRGPSHPQRSATTILLVINVLAFVIQAFFEQKHQAWVDHYLYLSPTGMARYFFWQLLTFQFLHAGVFHLLMNMLGLYFFGRAIEETVGTREFLKIYFGGGFLGGIIQTAFGFLFPLHFNSYVVGASAGVMALVAAFATMFPDRQITLLLFLILPVNLRARYLLWGALGLTLFGLARTIFETTPFAVVSNVADAAHLGGILFGVGFVYWSVRGHSIRFPWPRLRRPGHPRRELVGATAPKKGFWQRPKASELEEMTAADFMSQEVDPILDKISAHGIHSLTERERKILEVARSKMAKR